MAENPALVSMAQQFTGLPMGDLIGAPLKAAAEANAMMAVTQVNFLLNTAFFVDENGDYQPVMIKMSLTRGLLVPVDPTANPPAEPKIEEVTTTFELPLLTLLPLNSLAVDEVNVTFDMEVASSFSDVTNETTETSMAADASWEAKIGYGIFSATVSGSVSYDSKSTSSHETAYEKSNSAKYSVLVHAGQLPLPDGVKVIIQAFTDSISPITMPVVAAA